MPTARFIPLAAINDSTLMAATIVAQVAPGDNSNKPPQTRVIELLRPQATLWCWTIWNRSLARHP
ncbi:MAG: hypothetical protein R2867_18140 [Caldilineaceae bacterium]